MQPKGAPSPPHSTVFPHFVPLEAEEVTQSFALDFLQNQQNQPNDPQTEVPTPTPNLTNFLGPTSGKQSPPGIPRLVTSHLAHAQGKELQELKPSWETPPRARNTFGTLEAKNQNPTKLLS